MNSRDSDLLLLEARVAHAATERERVDALNALLRRLCEGGSDRAFLLSEEALERATALDYPEGVVAALRNRASCYLIRSDYEAAERDYLQAQEIARTHGLLGAQAACLMGLSTLRRKALDYPAAEALLQAGRDLAHQGGDFGVEVCCWNNLASLYQQMGRSQEASDAARHGAEAADSAGDRSGALFCRTNELIISCERDGPDLWVEPLEVCLQEAESIGHSYLQAHLLAVLSDAYLKVNRVEEALQTNEMALRLAHTHRDLQLEMLLLLSLGHILEALGLLLPADAAFERAARRAQQVQDNELLARVIEERAQCHERQGNLSSARQLFAELEALATRIGAQAHVALAAEGRKRLQARESALRESRLEEDAPEDADSGGDPEQRPDDGGDPGRSLEIHRVRRGC